MLHWKIVTSEDRLEFYKDLRRIVEASEYREYRVDVNFCNNADAGVYSRMICQFSFASPDLDDVLSMIDQQIDYGFEWSFYVDIFFIELGAPISDGVKTI